MMALQQLEQWPADLAAAGWIDSSGHTREAGPTGHRFPLASVTKALFGYVILIAVEEGTLDFDQPAGPNGATIRHLLAHASGIGERPDQYLTPVGRRRIYSNGAFELLGQLLAESASMPAARYFREALVEPLRLGATSLDGSPANGAASSVVDLLSVAAEWLNPTLVAPATMAEATTAQFPSLDGPLPGYGRQRPNPWGLGFELRGSKSPHWTGSTNSPSTFGHFGRSGTFIWIDPVAEVGCVALTDREFGPWAVQAWPSLADAVLADAAAPSL